MRDSLLRKHSLFLLTRDTLAGTNANPNLTFITNGWQIRWMHFHYGKVPRWKTELSDVEHGQRLNIAIRTKCSEILKQLVCDAQATQSSIVFRSNDQIRGQPMIREVIRK